MQPNQIAIRMFEPTSKDTLQFVEEAALSLDYSELEEKQAAIIMNYLQGKDVSIRSFTHWICIFPVYQLYLIINIRKLVQAQFYTTL